MKRILTYASAALLLTGCIKNNTDNKIFDANGGAHQITVVAGAPDTKTAIGHADGKYNFIWITDDKIKVFEYVAEKKTSISAESEPLAESGAGENKARFLVTMPQLPKESSENYHYLVVYPSSASLDVSEWVENKGVGTGSYYPKLLLQIPENQVVSSTYGFDPAADILVSEDKNLGEVPSSIYIAFARIGGILKLHLTGLPTEGTSKYVCGGSISAAGTMYQFAGKYIYDPVERMLENYGTSYMSQMNFTAADGALPIVDGAADVYLRCGAGTLDGEVTVSLSIKVDGKDQTYSKSFKIEGGSTGTGSTGTGSTGSTGAGSTGGGGTVGVEIGNGEITQMGIALVREVPYEIYLGGMSGYENKIFGEAEVVSKSGGSIPEMDATVYYNTDNKAATPEEFILSGGTVSQSLGKVASDGKIEFLLQGLDYNTVYYVCVVAEYLGEKYYTEVQAVKTGSEYKVEITGKTVVENTCTVSAEVSSLKGGTLPKMFGYVFYNTVFYYDPDQFISAPGVKSLPVGELVDGKVEAVLSELSESTQYYFCVCVTDEAQMCYSSVDNFVSGKKKQPVAYPSVNITAGSDNFSANWLPVDGAAGYNCYYYSESNPKATVVVTASELPDDPDKKWGLEVKDVAQDSYVLKVIPIPDASHAECVYTPDWKFKVADTPTGSQKMTLSAGGYDSTKKMLYLSVKATDKSLYGKTVTVFYSSTEPSKPEDLSKGEVFASGTLNSYGNATLSGSYSSGTYYFCAFVDVDYSNVLNYTGTGK